MSKVVHRKVDVDGIDIHYREAGPKDGPAILLLHGFPSAGHMFRDLIPLLADRYRLIAPDFPGFGQSDLPPHDLFFYTFANLAKMVALFADIVELDRFAIYIFDYGSPIGLRLATDHPKRITAIISQNGNAYEEGLSDGWNPVKEYWKNPTEANRDALRSLLSPSATIRQYLQGVPDPSVVSPDGYSLDEFYMERHDAHEAQMDLLLDYRTNVALYPTFHAYFREHKPPLLAVWGQNDPFFVPAGAEAFRRDIPDAEIHFFDTGHFALETHASEIAERIRDFLDRRLPSP